MAGVMAKGMSHCIANRCPVFPKALNNFSTWKKKKGEKKNTQLIFHVDHPTWKLGGELRILRAELEKPQSAQRRQSQGEERKEERPVAFTGGPSWLGNDRTEDVCSWSHL